MSVNAIQGLVAVRTAKAEMQKIVDGSIELRMLAMRLGQLHPVPDSSTSRLETDGRELLESRSRLFEAHERERSWIARELHDDIGQRILALELRLQAAAAQKSSTTPGDYRALIADAVEELSILAADIHAFSRRLHPAKLELLGLVAASAGLCREMASRHGIAIDVSHAGVADDLPKPVALALFRVLQEALTNAVKHSRASRVVATLWGTPGEVHLRVVDDGVGFDVGVALQGEGIGLVSMRERLVPLGGALTIESRPNGGTSVFARAPSALKPRSGA